VTQLPTPAAPQDLDAVLDRAAAEYLAARGALTTALERAASAVQRGMMRLPPEIQRLAGERAREGLELAWRVAILGLDPETRREHGAAYRLTGALSGALGGFGGLPTTLAELPVTTGLIMRSVADIARARGLDLGAEEVRRACIEVFAFGGPLEEDDDADLAFWMTRLAGQEVAQLIAAVIARYAPVLVTKLGAQAAPLVGAAVGAGLNLVYMAFYQRMARVVFDLLPLERALGREAARRAFAARVDAKRRARGEDARFGR
jgi:hypothetical protein